jgi:hypothetical protein
MTGRALVSQGVISHSIGGQTPQGVLSLVCFALVVVAFWKCEWKFGLLEIFLILVATNIGRFVFKPMNRSMNRRIEGPWSNNALERGAPTSPRPTFDEPQVGALVVFPASASTSHGPRGRMTVKEAHT